MNLCTEADDQPEMCCKNSATDSQDFSSQSTSFSNTSDGILAKSLVAKSTNQEKLEQLNKTLDSSLTPCLLSGPFSDELLSKLMTAIRKMLAIVDSS